MHLPPLPPPEAIALLQPFERLGLDRIRLVATADQAAGAGEVLARHATWGFDTESRPTFEVGEASEGPHTIQLATREEAFVFQLHDPGCRAAAAALLARPGFVKAGFGLGDDRRRIARKLGVELQEVVDLDTLFRQRGYRRQVGVKTAVAILFQRRYLKSKKAATSNWANRRLTEAQLLYAANDAWAALRVYEALRALAAAPPAPCAAAASARR